MEEAKPKGKSASHVLILPYPAQGHINPMLQFAKRLVFKGVKATLATTVYINKSSTLSISDQAESSITVETISDGFDDGGYDQAESTEAYNESLRTVGSQTLANIIKKFADMGRPVHALVYDGFLDWALDVAKQFGILSVVFFTQSCAVNSVYYHVNKGFLQVPLSGSNVSLPGLPLLEVSDTPTFVCDYGSYPGWTHVVLNQFSNVEDADWVLFNCFYESDKEAVDWWGSKLRKVATVGPTVPSLYLDKRLQDDNDYGIHLFRPDTSACMGWIRDKPNASVVYVSFGSYAKLGTEQMAELAWALKESNSYFLWVVRGTEEATLPPHFKEETAEKGLVVSWCPQLEVLAHDAVGCFVTHCGFNSVMEALSLGVPMLAMPQWTDQSTNAKYVEDVWGIGIRARRDEMGIVKREAIGMCLKELMGGERGKEFKKNALKWKNLAREAADEGGSSDRNVDEFVAELR